MLLMFSFLKKKLRKIMTRLKSYPTVSTCYGSKNTKYYNAMKEMLYTLHLTRSLPGTSILVLATLFSYAGDEYTLPSLFIAQRTQIQLKIKTNYKHL